MVYGDLTAKRCRVYLQKTNMPVNVRTRLLEYQTLLSDIRQSYPRLHPVITHYAKASMHPEERRYRYGIARAMSLPHKDSARIRDWREHTFFRYIVEWIHEHRS